MYKKINLIIKNRQSGKDAYVYTEFKKDTNNTFVIFHNRASIIGFNKRINEYNSNFFTIDELRGSKLRESKQFKKIIINNYFNLQKSDKMFLYDYISSWYFDEVILISTPYKLYDSLLINLIQQAKLQQIDINKFCEIFKLFKFDIIEEYWYNFITEPNINIIQNNILNNQDIINNVNNITLLSEEEYKTQILGKYKK